MEPQQVVQPGPPQNTTPITPIPPTQPEPKKKLSNKKLIFSGLVLLIVAGLGWWLTKPSAKTTPTSSTKKVNVAQVTSQKVLVLDPIKNYGNKYASGILPVGDNKYSTDSAKVGNIFACGGYASNLSSSHQGASSRGPWFVGTTQYDLNKKLHIEGAVSWVPNLVIKTQNNQRVITTNDLPSHKTGTFPVKSTDPAYTYDRNPNQITAQTLTFTLNLSPSYGDPKCMGGQVGVMLTGAALFNGFDAGGRDAGAWEVQDSCDGHPEKTGEYHYHTLSSCITDTSVNTVIGYALDGYPITGPKVGENNFLTTSDLDVCHGITSSINLDNKKLTTYHYVMTQDFPYSASCFRSTATQLGGPPS
jgi:hypothetical protein